MEATLEEDLILVKAQQREKTVLTPCQCKQSIFSNVVCISRAVPVNLDKK